MITIHWRVYIYVAFTGLQNRVRPKTEQLIVNDNFDLTRIKESK